MLLSENMLNQPVTPKDVGVAHILDPNTGLGINYAVMAW